MSLGIRSLLDGFHIKVYRIYLKSITHLKATW